MKHSQKIKGRLIYTFSLGVLYESVGRSFLLEKTFEYYIFFPILIFLYYIFEMFSFEKKYRYREFIITGIINSIIFLLLFIYLKDKNILLVFLVFTIFQNIFKYYCCKIFRKYHKVVILGKDRECKLENIICKNENFEYCGCMEKEGVEILKKTQIREVIYSKEIENEVLDKIYDLKMSGIKIVDSLSFQQEAEGKIDVDGINKSWIVNTSGFEVLSSSVEQRIKRAMDLVMALIIVGISFPFIIFTYFLVKLDNPKNFLKNPAFFKQKRIGAGGKEFEIIKFRSMKIHDPKEHSKYASEKDNRITKVGKFIRKSRLDELPQILNVLKGEMSFVGPRPEWNELGREYEDKINMYKIRYAVKPGLTGWAQVMYPYGASIEDAKKKLEYDIYYVKHQNFILDIIILFKTVKIVLFGKGL